MATKKPKEKKDRNDIRISDVPDKLFKKIEANKEKSGRRSNGAEVLQFLIDKKYK